MCEIPFDDINCVELLVQFLEILFIQDTTKSTEKVNTNLWTIVMHAICTALKTRKLLTLQFTKILKFIRNIMMIEKAINNIQGDIITGIQSK